MDRDELKSNVLACGWQDLTPHFARGGLLLLSPGLDLLDAASVIAGDDSAAVEGLLDSGGLEKLSDDQAKDYEARIKDVRFQVVILQPYVLAQEVVEKSDSDEDEDD